MRPVVHLVPFSPTGTTRRTLENIAAGMEEADVRIRDFTLSGGRGTPLSFTESDLVVIGMPVYYGRIPKLFHAGLPLRGNGAAAVYVVVYGNRAYDDALLELKELGEAAGFASLGAAAFIAEHSLNSAIATGRPDADDAAAERAFGRDALARAAGRSHAPLPFLAVSGHSPYRAYGALPSPDVDPDVCIACTGCVEVCPVDAIDEEDFTLRNREACLSCHACVRICPVAARNLGPGEGPFTAKMAQLAQACRERKEPDVFWA